MQRVEISLHRYWEKVKSLAESDIYLIISECQTLIYLRQFQRTVSDTTVFESKPVDLNLSGSCLITSLNYGLPLQKNGTLKYIKQFYISSLGFSGTLKAPNEFKLPLVKNSNSRSFGHLIFLKLGNDQHDQLDIFVFLIYLGGWKIAQNYRITTTT